MAFVFFSRELYFQSIKKSVTLAHYTAKIPGGKKTMTTKKHTHVSQIWRERVSTAFSVLLTHQTHQKQKKTRYMIPGQN